MNNAHEYYSKMCTDAFVAAAPRMASIIRHIITTYGAGQRRAVREVIMKNTEPGSIVRQAGLMYLEACIREVKGGK